MQIALVVAAAVSPALAEGREFVVGPRSKLKTPNDVPWESLEPGDRVTIEWRPEPYRSKWVICRKGTKKSPIIVRGQRGKDGQRPVIDASGASTRAVLDYWNENRGVIKIGGANHPADTTPAWIVIEDLEIRGARPGARYRGREGEQEYAENAAAIFIEKGENITVRSCVLRDSGNGFFSAPASRDIVLARSVLLENGNPASAYEHNSYTSGSGVTLEFNRFGPLVAASNGNNVKDRSAGFVFRFNWVEGGNRQLDLVDAAADATESGGAAKKKAHPSADPRYRETWVYGNVLVEREDDGNGQIIHYGGDSDDVSGYRNGTLYLFHNTILSLRTDTTTLLRLSTEREKADVRNNIIHVAGAGGGLAILESAGSVSLERNWLSDGWKPSLDTGSGTVQASANLSGTDPGFVAIAEGNLRLGRTSAALDAAGELAPAARKPHPIDQQRAMDGSSEKRRPKGKPDLGAYESGTR
jgi:hypothetical protein